MSLYSLTGRKGELLRKAEHEELTPEELEELMLIDDNRSSLFELLGKFIRSLKAESKIVNAEKMEFTNRERAIKQNIERVQDLVLADMQINKERSHKAGQFLFSCVDNRRTLNVVDNDVLYESRPDLVNVEYKPDKTAINKEFNQTGEIFEGTEPNPPTSHLRIKVGGTPKTEEGE